MDHGKNVRSPSLEQGTKYIMKTWGKAATFSEVEFAGFVSGGQLYKSPNRQLKDMTATDYYKLVASDGAFKGAMHDNCLVHETSKSRITFFHLSGVSAPAKAATPKTARVKKTNAAPAPTPEELAAAAKKAKQEAANKRKRDARAAKKVAAQPSEQSETQSETASETPASEIETEAQADSQPETVADAGSEHVEPETETEASEEVTEQHAEHASDDIPVHTATSDEGASVAA